VGVRARAALRQARLATALFAAATIAANAGPASPGATAAQIEAGHALYVRHCQQCHGDNMVTPGTIVFDLRRFPYDEEARFVDSVTNGKNGRMPAWGDMLTQAQIKLLWAYVKSGGKP
jgi:mono/diheme cytochrome c family protein